MSVIIFKSLYFIEDYYKKIFAIIKSTRTIRNVIEPYVIMRFPYVFKGENEAYEMLINSPYQSPETNFIYEFSVYYKINDKPVFYSSRLAKIKDINRFIKNKRIKKITFYDLTKNGEIDFTHPNDVESLSFFQFFESIGEEELFLKISKFPNLKELNFNNVCLKSFATKKLFQLIPSTLQKLHINNHIYHFNRSPFGVLDLSLFPNLIELYCQGFSIILAEIPIRSLTIFHCNVSLNFYEELPSSITFLSLGECGGASDIINLEHLVNLKVIDNYFLWDICTTLKIIFPKNITTIESYFIGMPESKEMILTELDLSNFSKVKTIKKNFLIDLSSLKRIDLSGFDNDDLRIDPIGFMQGCIRIQHVKLSRKIPKRIEEIIKNALSRRIVQYEYV